ncbi:MULTISPECIES: ribosome maturation factor RimP [Campylobacter]|uniref:Ribosome maturation factor RimP n=1 Tax=Campylobacter porcelli TaxID=1660073 RepID=A0ABU7M4S8_9BACT|nr:MULTISPECIES: ribosome maturation factor RimP [unclassified Campylobacter]MCR8679170.1 ribosome maturation factor RimP [Campylobacter sp. RM19072]MCR8696004.1 ribosome maturation factor RimP [Campylobacter sp. RM19073]MEE3744714.1 ribosome maturation factor RimP [Campylobacter sp. CX2-4855-23]MEE3776439.1 ribosome maturation factor RimP [Campylobacter sp. CX2-4080-23]
MNLEELEKLLQGCGVALYDTEIANENGRQIYRVYITKSGGVSLDDCEVVSKLLSPIYDVMPPVSGDWVLEVSSPGLERKLSKIDHFAKSIGEMAKITLNDKSQIIGKITSVNGDDIALSSDEGSLSLNFNDIKKAKTFIQW